MLADQPAYRLVFRGCSAGWRPMIVDEGFASLSIGRYCSIAAYSMIVLGNHVTAAATTPTRSPCCMTTGRPRRPGSA